MKRTTTTRNGPIEDEFNGPKGDNNILKRLKTFLPQIAAANEELQQKLNSSQNVESSFQIDTSLATDGTCDSDDQEEQEEEEEGEEGSVNDDHDADDHDDNDDGKKVIQLTVTLGNFDSNPVMSLLGDADDHDEDSSHHDSSSNYDSNPTGSIVLPNIGKELSDNNQEASKGLFTIRSSRRKDKL
jgi:hypothetical protein